MNQINVQTSMSFADLLDRAFRLYRMHFFTLWSATVPIFALTFSLAICLTIVFSTLWPFAFLGFVNLVIGLKVLVDVIARLAIDQAAPRDTRIRDQIRQYTSVFGAQGLQLIILLLPFALLIGCLFLLDFVYRDEPAPMGSADTASEQMFYLISLLFLLIYPCFVAYMASSFRLVVPAIVLEHIGSLNGLKRSWQLVQPSLRKPFLALVLIVILHGITQIPSLLLLWQSPLISGDPSQGFKMLLLAITVQSDLSVWLPIEAAMTTLLYWDFHNRAFLRDANTT
jgi:hypothetical protein